MDEQFVFMKKCLEEFNYPEIHSLTEIEMTDIFSKTNRQFLVSWILKVIDEDYESFVTNGDKKDLAGIVYCNGFCTKSEKDAFMDGECEYERQFEILYKMFKHLKSVSDSRKSKENCEKIPISEIEYCSTFNRNLFPMLGGKKTFTKAQRIEKVNECLKEIDNIKNLISLHSDVATDSVDSSLRQQLQTNMQQLEDNYPNYKRKLFDLIKDKDQDVPQEIHFTEDFGKTLQTSSKNLKNVVEFIRSMTLVTNFDENHKPIGNQDCNNNAMMRELADLCNEIIILKKKESCP